MAILFGGVFNFLFSKLNGVVNVGRSYLTNMKSSLKVSDTLGLLWGAGDLKYPTFVPSELARVPRKCKSDLGGNHWLDKNINFDQKLKQGQEYNLDSGRVDRKEGKGFL